MSAMCVAIRFAVLLIFRLITTVNTLKSCCLADSPPIPFPFPSPVGNRVSGFACCNFPDRVAAAISVRLKPSQLMDKWSKCLRPAAPPSAPPLVSAFNKQIALSVAIVELTQMMQTQIR